MSKIVNPRQLPARGGLRPMQNAGPVQAQGLQLEQVSQPGPAVSSAPTPVLQQFAVFP